MIHIIGNLYSVEVPNNNIQYKIEVISENDEFEEETMLIFDTLDFSPKHSTITIREVHHKN